MQVKPFQLLILFFLLRCQESTSKTTKKYMDCKFEEFTEGDIYNAGLYTGTAGRIISGYVKTKKTNKKQVVLDSMNFLDLLSTPSASEKTILSKIKDFETKGLEVDSKKIEKLLSSKIAYLKTEDKNILKEINNKTILTKYFRNTGNNLYILDKPPIDPSTLYSELVNQRIKVKTGGYLGYPMVICKP